MEAPSYTYKLILTFQDFTQNIEIPHLSLHVIFGNTTKTVPLPFTEAVLVEASALSHNSTIQFQLEQKNGNFVGYSELKIPSSVYNSDEAELSQSITFQIVKGSKTSLTTNVSAIFLRKKKVAKPEKSDQSIEALRAKILSVQSLTNLRKKPGSKDTTPMKKRANDSPSPSRKPTMVPAQEQEAFVQLVQLNRNENNIPQSILQDDTLLRLDIDFDSSQFMKSTSEIGVSNSPNRGSQTPGNSQKKKLKKSRSSSKSNSKISLGNVSPTKMEFSILESMKKIDSESPSSPKKNGISLPTTSNGPSQSNLDNGKKKSKTGIFDFKERQERQISEAIQTLESNDGDKETSKLFIEYLKNTITTMTVKNNELTSMKNDHLQLIKDMKKAETEKASIHEQTMQMNKILKQENAQLKAHLATILNRNSEENEKTQQIQFDISKAKEINERLNYNLRLKENQLLEATIKKEELDDLKVQLKKAHSSLAKTEAERAEDQRNFMDALARLRGTYEETKVLLERAYMEKRDLVLQLAQERLDHQETKNEIIIVKKDLANAEAYKEVITALETQRDGLLRQLSESRAEREEASRIIENVQMNLNVQLRDFETKEAEYALKLQAFQDAAQTNEFKCYNLTRQANESDLKVSDLSLKIQELEHALEAQNQVHQEVDELKARLVQSINEKDTINKGVEALTENHQMLSQKVLDIQKVNDELSHAVVQKDHEIFELKEALIDVLQNIEAEPTPKYVPAKGDAIDNALAEFLNSSPNASKYRVLFIREAEGVYQFGSKKVYIKIEGDKFVVRVGGGYMTISELLEHVAPTEFEKLSKFTRASDDDAGKIVARNLVLNKVLAGRSVNLFDKSRTQAYKLTRAHTLKPETTDTSIYMRDMSPIGSKSPSKQGF